MSIVTWQENEHLDVLQKREKQPSIAVSKPERMSVYQIFKHCQSKGLGEDVFLEMIVAHGHILKRKEEPCTV